MKITTLLLLIFSSLLTFGQKDSPVQLEANEALLFTNNTLHISQGHVPEGELKQLISSEAGYTKEVSLETSYTRSSKTLSHQHFDIYLSSVRVYGAAVHLATDYSGKIRLLEAPHLPTSISNSSFPSPDVAEAVRQQIGAETILNAEQVWLNAGQEELGKGLVIELAGPETLHREVVYANGKIIHQADLHRYHSHASAGPNDTTVSVRVFDPDPLTTAQVNYGGQYIDNNDQNVGVLNVQRQQRNTTFSYSNGLFTTENDFVKITEFSAPATSPVVSASGQFNYTRDKDEFEDVNVMYHITHHCNHLADLGYGHLPGYQIQVDAHALAGADQSFFSTSVFPYRLYFGEGGVDDAEDADVILHEFSHAVIYEAAPSSTNSTERSCIEEAICDYFAVSYSRTVNGFNRDLVFNWDGHNDFWPGRKAKSEKDYQETSFSGNFYLHTDLMASPLLEIYDNIGRDLTDQLVLESIFSLKPNTTMPEVAGYMLLSDSLLNGGMNTNVITAAFMARGIIPKIISLGENATSPTRIEISNTYGFASGGALSITSEEKLAYWKLYDLQGRLIMEATNLQHTSATVSSESLPSGFYLLYAGTVNGNEVTTKLTKAVE